MACFAGSDHSAILSAANELYLFGANAKGQCGYDGAAELLTPRKLPMENIEKVALGDGCTAITSKQERQESESIFHLPSNHRLNMAIAINSRPISVGISIQSESQFGSADWHLVKNEVVRPSATSSKRKRSKPKRARRSGVEFAIECGLGVKGLLN